jgi:hypothetical protein
MDNRRWDGQQLFNAVTGEVVATATSKGLDFRSMTSMQEKLVTGTCAK